MNIILNYFRDLKFRWKLMISYLVVIIIPVSVLGIYSYSQAKEFLIQQAKQGLNDSIRQVAENIDYKMKKYETMIDFVAFNKQIQDMINNDYSNYSILYSDIIQQIDPVFNSVINLNEDVEQITMYTTSNMPEYRKFILSADRLKDKPYMSQIKKNNVTYWFKISGELFGVQRINKGYGYKESYLYIKLKDQSVFENFKSLRSSNYGVLISDSRGTTIFDKDNFEEDRYTAINKQSIIKREQGNIHLNGQDYLLIKSSIPESSWDIYFYTLSSSIAVDAKSIVSATIIIVGICIIVLTLIIIMFSRTFVSRINFLNKNMEQVEKGNLNIIIESHSKDEVGQLINRFSKMLENINMLIKEVYHSKITQKEAELKALQAQINPHFLYNTLSVINWKAIEIEADEISHITTTVSDFYRAILNKGKNVISINNEIGNTKAYIEIQLIMHSYSFEVEYLFEEDIYEYNMINIILQPIVENAIGHGIDHKTTEGIGKLKISGYLKDDNIEFLVEDNGCGMTTDVVNEILTKNTKGYGLKNVHDRVRIFFGEEYGLNIQSQVGIGTTVKVVIPKFKGNEEIQKKPMIDLLNL